MSDPSTSRTAVIVALPAAVDDLSATQAYDQLYAAVAIDAQVVVAGFTATVSCDHWALLRLLAAQRRVAARDAQLRVVAPPGGPVSRVLEITGLDKLLPVFPTAYHAAAAPMTIAPGSGARD